MSILSMTDRDQLIQARVQMLLNIWSWLKTDLSSTPLIHRKIILFQHIKWENKEKQIIERATLAKITTLSVSISGTFSIINVCV